MVARDTTGELLRLEKEFWDAIKLKDGRAAARLTADNCIIVGAQGVSAIDRETMMKMTEEGQWTLEHYDFDESTIQVQLLGDAVAVVAYTVRERLVVGGHALTLDANDSSVWVKRNDGWLCAMHTESPAGDPFARDKKNA